MFGVESSTSLGGTSSSVILAGAYYGGWNVGWLLLDLWGAVEGQVLYTLNDGGEGMSGWVVGMVFIGGLCGAFVWVETLVGSSWGHRQGCLQA
jgi:hypothetical protein